jgi:hypothetical protein
MSHQRNGFLLIDIAFASALIAVLIIPLVLLLQTTRSPLAAGAPLVLYAATADVFDESRHSFSTLASRTYTRDGYAVTVTVAEPQFLIKHVAVRVAWGILPWQRLESTLTVSDIVRARMVDTCNYSLVWNDWSRVRQVASVSLPASTTPTGISIRQGIAYVALDSSIATSSDLLVFDLTQPEPVQLASYHTGPGLASITLWGTTLFAAQRSTAHGMQIIDVADRAHPAVIANIALPGVVPSGPSGMATAITANEHWVVVGTSKNNGPELFAFRRTESGAIFHGSQEIDAGINDLALDATTLYVASPLNTKELQVFALGTTTPFVLRGVYDPPGGSGNGKSIALLGDDIVLGRTVGRDELHLLTDELTFIDSFNSDTSINSLASNGRWLFGATTNSDRALSLFAASTAISQTSTYSLPSRARGVACWFRSVAVISESSPLLTIYTLDESP